jgi:hypothetical protein
VGTPPIPTCILAEGEMKVCRDEVGEAFSSMTKCDEGRGQAVQSLPGRGDRACAAPTKRDRRVGKGSRHIR